MERTVFITGGTGLVGGSLVIRLLRDTSVSRIDLLARDRAGWSARERLFDHLRAFDPTILSDASVEKIRVLPGDVTRPALGLSDATYEEVASTTSHIIHAAANVRFDARLEDLRRTNCQGAAEMLRLAHRARDVGRLERIGYVGTAYVSGSRGGTIYEREFELPPAFSNPYEQSKYEAETLVRAEWERLPITIFRPSIIAGDSRTGVTTAFNGIYHPLRLIFDGVVRYFPGSRGTRLDVVPIDFVTEAIHVLMFRSGPLESRCFHLCCGSDRVSTAGEILDLAVDYFRASDTRRRIPKVSFIPLPLFRAVERIPVRRARMFFRKVRMYLPYIALDRAFDTSETRRALQGTSIVPPLFGAYHENLLRFCVDTNWGRSAP